MIRQLRSIWIWGASASVIVLWCPVLAVVWLFDRDPLKRLSVTEAVERFKAEKTNCILCGQCVRYCREIKKANAIGFVGRGIERRVVFFPEIATTVCASCRECFSLCPTAKLPSETDGVSFDNLTLGDFLKVK